MGDKPKELNLVDKIFEFLYSTPEEVRQREIEFEKELKRRKFVIIEGGKYETRS
jgi:hypothetical protein